MFRVNHSNRLETRREFPELHIHARTGALQIDEHGAYADRSREIRIARARCFVDRKVPAADVIEARCVLAADRFDEVRGFYVDTSQRK